MEEEGQTGDYVVVVVVGGLEGRWTREHPSRHHIEPKARPSPPKPLIIGEEGA